MSLTSKGGGERARQRRPPEVLDGRVASRLSGHDEEDRGGHYCRQRHARLKKEARVAERVGEGTGTLIIQ